MRLDSRDVRGHGRILIACLGTAIVVALAVGAVIMLRGNGFSVAHGKPAAAATGDALPDVTLDDADGAPVTTSTLASKPALVWFSDSSCPDLGGVRKIARLERWQGSSP